MEKNHQKGNNYRTHILYSLTFSVQISMHSYFEEKIYVVFRKIEKLAAGFERFFMISFFIISVAER